MVESDQRKSKPKESGNKEANSPVSSCIINVKLRQLKFCLILTICHTRNTVIIHINSPYEIILAEVSETAFNKRPFTLYCEWKSNQILSQIMFLKKREQIYSKFL